MGSRDGLRAVLQEELEAADLLAQGPGWVALEGAVEADGFEARRLIFDGSGALARLELKLEGAVFLVEERGVLVGGLEAGWVELEIGEFFPFEVILEAGVLARGLVSGGAFDGGVLVLGHVAEEVLEGEVGGGSVLVALEREFLEGVADVGLVEDYFLV